MLVKLNKARLACIFLGMYCKSRYGMYIFRQGMFILATVYMVYIVSIAKKARYFRAILDCITEHCGKRSL